MTGGGLTTIITNARIPTGESARPWATALGIRDGKLAVVGSAAEILKMASTHTQIVDASRQVVELPAGWKLGSPIAMTIDADGRVTICAAPIES